MNREQIRAATLGTNPVFKRETVKVGETEVEVRQPSVAERAEIIRGSMIFKDQDGEQSATIDTLKVRVNGILSCCYVPGTEEKVFEEADRAALLSRPCEDFVDTLGDAVLRIMNFGRDTAKN